MVSLQEAGTIFELPGLLGEDIPKQRLLLDVDGFGILADTYYAHERFAEEYDLTFLVLDDTMGEMSHRSGIDYDPAESYRGILCRTVLSADTEWLGVFRWTVDNANESLNVDERTDELRKLPETERVRRNE